MTTPAPGRPTPHRSRARWYRTPLALALIAGCAWGAHTYAPDSVRDALTRVLTPQSIGAHDGELTAPLPPASERDYPPPGLGEAPQSLGTAPAAPDTLAAHAFSQMQTETDGTTTPVAWSPCRPIHYVIDPTGAPAGFIEQTAAAVADVTAATGLVFTYDGEVTEAATHDRAAFQPGTYGDRWAPVLIRFADPANLPDLHGDVAGVAIPVTVTQPITGAAHIVSGAVYLDPEVLTAADVAGLPRYVPVLRHELAHLVGLGHVDDSSQLMFPELTDVTTFQPGDLAGLSALGQGRCAPDV